MKSNLIERFKSDLILLEDICSYHNNYFLNAQLELFKHLVDALENSSIKKEDAESFAHQMKIIHDLKTSKASKSIETSRLLVSFAFTFIKDFYENES